MFDDFSPQSQKAIREAEALAERLGDESVATGHLIYGLTVDPAVCLFHIFKDLNIDPDMFADYVKSLPREPAIDTEHPYNRHCMTVFDRARETAEMLGTKIVQPEHIAVALLSVKAGSCYETLKEFSIDPEYVRLLVMESMGLETEDAPDWF